MTSNQDKKLQEIKKRLDQIKAKSQEISIIIPAKPGKSMLKNFNKINKILDEMLKK
tara:strand:+ start:499 stop:666 length:168 start_codon:yes stop_codon:yes gene_type:complete